MGGFVGVIAMLYLIGRFGLSQKKAAAATIEELILSNMQARGWPDCAVDTVSEPPAETT